MHSAVYAVVRCLSVCLSVCHTRVLFELIIKQLTLGYSIGTLTIIGLQF